MAASIDTAVSHCDSLATNTAASLKTPLLCDLRQLALKRRQFLVTMAPLTRQRIVPQQPAFIAPTATLTSTDAEFFTDDDIRYTFFTCPRQGLALALRAVAFISLLLCPATPPSALSRLF